MADEKLRSVIQQMIDAGESEENILSVVKEYNKVQTHRQKNQTITEPTTFWGGVQKSLGLDEKGPGFFGSDAWNTGMRGLQGYAQGAIADLPSSIMGGIKSAADAFQDPTGLKTVGMAMLNPQGPERQEVLAAGQMPSQLMNTVSQAGTQPEEFGRLMGQVTGQPLVTEGVMKTAPMLKQPVGAGLENVGNVIRRKQPISGLFPRFLEGRTPRNIEGWLGGKLEDIGARMRIPTLEGEIVPPSPGLRTTEYMETPLRELPPASTIFNPSTFTEPIDINFNANYSPTGRAQTQLTGRGQQLGLPPSSVRPEFNLPSSLSEPLNLQPPMARPTPPRQLGTQTTATRTFESPSEYPKPTPEPPPTPTKQTAIVTKAQFNNTTFSYLKSKGYELVGIDEKGNFKFQLGDKK